MDGEAMWMVNEENDGTELFVIERRNGLKASPISIYNKIIPKDIETFKTRASQASASWSTQRRRIVGQFFEPAVPFETPPSQCTQIKDLHP